MGCNIEKKRKQRALIGSSQQRLAEKIKKLSEEEITSVRLTVIQKNKQENK